MASIIHQHIRTPAWAWTGADSASPPVEPLPHIPTPGLDFLRGNPYDISALTENWLRSGKCLEALYYNSDRRKRRE